MMGGLFAWLNEVLAMIARALGTVTHTLDGGLPAPIRRALADAWRVVGQPYEWGAEASPDDDHPAAFDCSELVQWCLTRAGLACPDGARAQYRWTSPVPVQDRRPGDLVFLADKGGGPGSISHVGIIAEDADTIVASMGPRS